MYRKQTIGVPLLGCTVFESGEPARVDLATARRPIGVKYSSKCPRLLIVAGVWPSELRFVGLSFNGHVSAFHVTCLLQSFPTL